MKIKIYIIYISKFTRIIQDCKDHMKYPYPISNINDYYIKMI